MYQILSSGIKNMFNFSLPHGTIIARLYAPTREKLPERFFLMGATKYAAHGITMKISNVDRQGDN
jgi:hypothetical protein